ncbi:MAG TPA: ribosome-associated translation inhibitor RaiA [Blastocatellia bacterium]|jgi:putative sigma-54 modulation protein|nr:ribosome-associated translation inhibitor RaiA [Blastocatellia bacterium]
MKLEFTGRNFTLTPAIKRHTSEHFDKLAPVLNGALKAHIILSVEKHHRHIAEIVVNWHDHALTGKADTTDMYVSVSKAVDRIRTQLLRVRGKIIDRKHHAVAVKQAAPGPIPPVLPDTPAPRIIRSRRYTVKPMTPEEAMLGIATSPEQFIVFRNAETSRVGVLYKRKDGNYGLIEP